MRKKRESLTNIRKNFIIKLDECKFVRQSGTTTVYLMKDNNAVKIYQDPTACKTEYYLLKKVKSKFFPKVYAFYGHYFIREYVNCINITKYISIYGFNKDLVLKIINLLEELKKLHLTKLNITLNDIFIKNDLKLILLNFNESLTDINLHEPLFDDLNKLGLLDEFLKILKNCDSRLFINWTK